MWRIVLSFLALAVLTTGCFNRDEETKFTYNDEELWQIESKKESKQKLTNQKLTKINQIAYNYVDNYAVMDDIDKLRFSPYLAAAQNDFAILSHYQGTFAPVTMGIIRIFSPTAEIIQLHTEDQTSKEIATIVVAKANERYNRENERIRDYKIRRGMNLWTPSSDYHGINYGSLLPWHLSSCNEFRCPKPSVDYSHLNKQVNIIRKEMTTIDGRKFNAISYWADEGDWESIAEAYMDEQQTPLEKRLAVRADLLTGLFDATVATFDSKYSHWVQRPSQYDFTVSEVFAPSSNPGYPSIHSTVGRASAVILTSYFPENSEQWDELAEEAGMSGIWAGIQFPMDHFEGSTLGEKVGSRVVNH